MRFRSHQCWLPKDVEHPGQYEDASACSEKESRVVIADGVSSAIFSRTWARLLTRTAALDPPDVTDSELVAQWLQPLQQKWREQIDFQKVSRDWARGPKLRSVGGQSTLLLAEVRAPADPSVRPEDNEYRLIGHAIGDCCLFLIRDGSKVQSFPMTDSAAFAEAPYALSSIVKDGDYAAKFEHFDEPCRVGDLIVLCTDAVGLWAMQEYEAGNQVDWMRYWENDLAWQEDILELRSRSPKDPRNRMRVDDCTLFLLQVISEQDDCETRDLTPDRSDAPFVLLTSADDDTTNATEPPSSPPAFADANAHNDTKAGTPDTALDTLTGQPAADLCSAPDEDASSGQVNADVVEDKEKTEPASCLEQVATTDSEASSTCTESAPAPPENETDPLNDDCSENNSSVPEKNAQTRSLLQSVRQILFGRKT